MEGLNDNPASEDELIDMVDPNTTTVEDILRWADALPGGDQKYKRIRNALAAKWGNEHPLVTGTHGEWTRTNKIIHWATH